MKVAPAVLLVVALALRLWGISDRLPDPSLGIDPLDDSAVEETDRTTMARAWDMWGGGESRLDFDPHTSGWPGLPFYVALLAQVTYKGVWALTSGEHGVGAFVRHIQLHPDRFFAFARLSGVVVGALSVAILWRLGVSVLGPAGGLLAALFLALNPAHIGASQHVADPNLLALLFSVAAVRAMVRFGDRPGFAPAVLAGALIGLAVSSKYVPIVLFLPLGWAHFEAIRGQRSRPRRAASTFAAAMLAAALVFAVTSPFAMLHGAVTSRDVLSQAGALTSDWTGQSRFPIALPDYLTRTLPRMLGVPLYGVALIGLAVLGMRGSGGRLVVIAAVALILANGMLSVAQPRYILPAVPFLLVGAAAAVTEGWSYARERLGGATRIALAGVLVLLLAPGAIELVETRRALAAPDTRHEARRWLNRHVPPEVPMAVELYGPVVNSGRVERLAILWPFFSVRPERVSAAYHVEYLDGFRIYVTSSGVSDRYRANPGRYPTENGYYDWLGARARPLWSSDTTRASGPVIRVLALPGPIGTADVRRKLWAEAVGSPMDSTRLGAWCGQAAMLFGMLGDSTRALEWAARQSSVARGP